jgi:biopolymer transport protein ExbD
VTLTPLIDVIFLLLLFFMLSSTFTRFAEVPLVNAGGHGAVAEAPLFLQLRPDDLALNGVAVPLEALAQAVRAQAADGGTVLVSLAPGVTAQRLVDLLAILRTVPGLTVIVLD